MEKEESGLLFFLFCILLLFVGMAVIFLSAIDKPDLVGERFAQLENKIIFLERTDGVLEHSSVTHDELAKAVESNKIVPVVRQEEPVSWANCRGILPVNGSFTLDCVRK